jgi:hypothetical protein
MYDLWQVGRRGGVTAVRKVGDYATVTAAKRAALRSGRGRYRICDAIGNALRVRVAGRRQAG